MREFAFLIYAGFGLYLVYTLVRVFLKYRWMSRRMARSERVREKVIQGIFDDEVVAYNAKLFEISEEEFRNWLPKEKRDERGKENHTAV